MKQLIINADDIGYPAGTVEAMVALYEAGAITSVTPMVNMPDWPQAAEYLRAHPDLGAGVHLVMNEGRPVLPPEQVPSLVEGQGKFYEGNALLLRVGRLRTRELEAEWRAQIEKFIADTGRQPDHLDLHCHYPYMFTSWFKANLRLAQAYGNLPIRMPFDKGLDQKAPRMAADSGAPAWYVRWAGRRYQKLAQRAGLKYPDYFEQSFTHDAYDHRHAEYLVQLMDTLPEGITELIGHPGLHEDWRAGDYRALIDPRVRERIAEKGIRLVNYRELAKQG